MCVNVSGESSVRGSFSRQGLLIFTSSRGGHVSTGLTSLERTFGAQGTTLWCPEAHNREGGSQNATKKHKTRRRNKKHDANHETQRQIQEHDKQLNIKSVHATANG